MASSARPDASSRRAEDGDFSRLRGRVLLVDDSPLVRDFVGGLISDWGFDVEKVGTAHAALASLAKESFDVIVAELNMPEMTGTELLTTLRMRSVDTPVIVLSSVSRTTEILRAIHQGAFDYVVKDEAIEPLRLAILRAIQHMRLVRENARLAREVDRLEAELEARVRERTWELEKANTRLLAERGELEAGLQHVNESREQLVQMEKMASIGILTAGVAHEINNPLAFILPNFELVEAWLQSARSGKKHAQVKSLDDLTKIVTECRRGLDRIARLVRQLRIFSHPGREELGALDVDAVVRSVSSLVEREIAGRATLTVHSRPSCLALGNEDQLRQVLLNLVINSAQSFPSHPSGAKIDIVVEGQGDEVAIRVVDNGCGIAPENMRRVFDPFFTTKPVGHGTGLGLPISRDLVKKMQGNITVESQVGRGTTVTITLRRWTEALAGHIPVTMRTPTPEPEVRAEVRRLSIIIVEDETALLLPLRRMLADQHEVLTFSDPRDGMRCLIERDPPDVIICDINMPEVNGLDLYREVTRVRPFLAKRFVFLTGGDSDELATLIAEAPNRVLEKPVHRKDLMAVISAISQERAAESP